MKTRLLHLLVVFLLLQLTNPALVPRIKNHPELKPRALNTYIVHANHRVKPPHFANLEQWYHSMVTVHSPTTANTSDRILYTYDTVMHGFAVQLTRDEAQHMATTSGVLGVYEDKMFHLQTTRSPGFMGLNPHYGAWNWTNFGDGVIIGFIDSGIWPESASFNDHGLGPLRSSWRGKCIDTDDFNASLCNNKLVGAKAFSSSADAMAATKSSRVLSPRDKDGHGTHVASTAAGAEVLDVGMDTFSQGTASGMAPKARIAMYKACDADAGNYGPSSGVANAAPWMTTVGAGTMDRMFPANLTLGNGVVLEGQSLYIMQANNTDMMELVYSYCFTESGNWTREKVKGKIMVCMDDGSRPDMYGFLLQKAGGAGIVVVENKEWYRDSTSASPFTLPGLTLGFDSGERLRAYMASETNPVASFSFISKTIIQQNQAPMVAGFSSRGPNPVVAELLKPDIIAPGVNILAGWSRDAPLYDGRRVDYNIISGTSVACPHVAGIAALIKKRHKNWTPAMIRSALMTTAKTLNNRNRDILDNGVTNDSIMVATPLAAGAGHVRPDLALDPGLVYDAGESDYIDFMCTLNYTSKQMRLLVPNFVKCTRTLPGGPANLNYPSFVVVFDNRTNVRTLTRTVTLVSEKAETYNVAAVAPERVKVAITPTTLEFTKPNEKKSYTVEFRSLAGGNVTAGWDFGHISWESKEHLVRSPVAFQWKN
ncbi:hypothetical protein PR202_gb21408 [Eleusine coracana subsp. coracana]|uniref:Uncharacterized protein n=1 Tax=Eleusine coracana subsp. coracana TaxID=191504 RepID=A0AAV5FDJ1_ELECO|nr:hypothetical protein PR202_gb21408 [Eleusine coracana subsp. coracana]